MVAVEDYAARLHGANDSWIIFFDQVLSLDGNIRQQYPENEERQLYENSDEYRNILKMFFDLLSRWRCKPRGMQREITVRLPESVHAWLKERANEEDYPTMSRYIVTKLMEGALSDGEIARVGPDNYR